MIERRIRGDYSRNFTLFTDGNELFQFGRRQIWRDFYEYRPGVTLVLIANCPKQLRKRGRFLQLTQAGSNGRSKGNRLLLRLAA